MSKKIVLAVILAIGAFIIDVFALLVLYEIYQVNDARDCVAFMLAVSTLVKVAVVFAVVSNRGRDLTKALFLLAAAAVVFLLMQAGPLRNVLHFEFWSGSMFPVAIGPAIVFVFTFIAWLNFSGSINRHRDDLKGIRSILHAAGLTICLPMVLIFFKTPILFGHLLFDVALVAFSASLLVPMTPAFVMRSQRKKTILYSLFITLPLAFYIGPFILGILGFAVDHRAEIADMIHAPETQLTQIDDSQQFLSTSLSAYQRVSNTRLYRDVHYFSDGRVCAIDDSHYYCKEEQEMVRRSGFDRPVKFLRFDQAGERGFARGEVDTLYFTDNGGSDWRLLDPAVIHAQQLGLDPADMGTRHVSPIHADLDSGEMSFVIKCHYYRSDDFAKQWQMVRPKDNTGEALCVASSPFAVDVARGLAVAKGEKTWDLFEQNSKTKHWIKRCAIRSTTLFSKASSVTWCRDLKDLPTDTAQFIEREKSSIPSIVSEPLDSGMIDQLVNGEQVDADEVQKAVRKQGGIEWIAQDNVWVSSNDGGVHWQAHVLLPNLLEIYPLDASRAFAKAYDETSNDALYYSDDAGARWRKVRMSDDEDHEQIKFNPVTNTLWLLTSRRVVKFTDTDPLNPETIDLPVESYPRAFYFSPDDLNVVTIGEERLHYTKDMQLWHTHEFADAPINALYNDYFGEDESGNITSLDCGFYDRLICMVGYSNATATVVHIDLVSNRREDKKLPVIPARFDDDEYIAHMRILNGPRYMVIPDGRSTGYEITEDDLKWRKLALNDFSDWSSVRVLPGGKSLIAEGYYNDFLLINDSGEVTNINIKSWSEGVGYCIDAAGEHMVMFDYAGNVALSTDRQLSWLSTDDFAFENPACGFNQNYFWLKHSSMSVFKRD